ncbi:MAG: hypothetical protein ACYCT1_12975, partial [Steroidobacteraceae bacterium]
PVSRLIGRKLLMATGEAERTAYDYRVFHTIKSDRLLEKIELAEPPLREQFAAASSAERARRWTDHLTAHRTAAAEFLVAARATHAAHARLVDVIQTARAEGFERNIAVGMPPAPNIHGAPICNPVLLDAFEKSFSPAPRQPGRAPRGGVRHYVGEPNSAHYDPTRPPGAPVSTGHPVFLDTWTGTEIRPGARIGERTSPAAALPDDSQPLTPDQVRVVVLRAGFQHSDGACHAGRRIRLDRDVALAAAQTGGVEIVETPTGAAP